jgi:hypothetical protein
MKHGSLVVSVNLAIAALYSLTPASSQAYTETQTFNSGSAAIAAGWTGTNTTINGHNFGFSPTNNTGGTSGGEFGGKMARAGEFAYYADRTIGGTYDRSASLSASGELDITTISVSPPFDNSIFVGHFNPDAPSLNLFAGHVGFNLAEESSGSVRFRAYISFSDGSFYLGNTLFLSGFPNSDRTWSYTWDPTGGNLGLGSLTASIDGPGGGTSTLELGVATIGKELVVSAFGGSIPGTTRPDGDRHAMVYIDNTTYSQMQAVPEPTVSALLVLGGAALRMQFRRRRKS